MISPSHYSHLAPKTISPEIPTSTKSSLSLPLHPIPVIDTILIPPSPLDPFFNPPSDYTGYSSQGIYHFNTSSPVLKSPTVLRLWNDSHGSYAVRQISETNSENEVLSFLVQTRSLINTKYRILLSNEPNPTHPLTEISQTSLTVDLHTDSFQYTPQTRLPLYLIIQLTDTLPTYKSGKLS